jgi:ubiquinone/menaquinone biosynthesis C-methylase UbiE
MLMRNHQEENMDILKVNTEKIRYTNTSGISPEYTRKMNRAYDWMAKVYDTFMVVFPLWKKWIKHVIPHIKGNKVLEVSFGSGYLMSEYSADNYDIYGIDYNEKMLEVTSKKMASKKISAKLSIANVEQLPFADNSFDTLINTMAFTGYPDGDKAMAEFNRVLKKNGTLLLVDFDYPKNRNVFGYSIVRLWEKFGDIIKNIDSLLINYGFNYQDIPIGGFGSVHFFIAKKMDERRDYLKLN